jgi:hypothetical protein
LLQTGNLINKTTIELNGKRYDAKTGAMLGGTATGTAPSGKNIDGFFRSRTTVPQTARPVTTQHPVDVVPRPAHHAATVKKVTASTSKSAKPAAARSVNHARSHAPEAAKTTAVRATAHAAVATHKPAAHSSSKQANHTKARNTQSSQTLMRASVRRPDPSLRKQLATKGSLQHSVPSLIVPKLSAVQVDSDRLARAQVTPRSPQIARHARAVHAPLIATIQPQLTPLAVQPVPVKPEGEEPSSPPSPQPTNKPIDIFEHALMNASHYVDVQAHHARFRLQTRRHLASMAAGTLALLVIAGFAAYQNTPGLQFKVASMHAGVATHMPNFKAAGFAFNGVKASGAKLTVGFSGVTGDYQLTQSPTNLSSSDMINTVGATDASGMPDYQTVQTGDTTVYRLSNTNATWVENGTWYTVSGSSYLTDNQLQSLVRNS